jgi:hypothetical protein
VFSRLLAIGCLVAAAVVAAPAAAPPAGGNVTAALFGRTQQGPFYDGAGNPSWQKLRNEVRLRDASGRVVAAVIPDQWGEFRFAHVVVGTYTFEFTYESLNDPVYDYRTYQRTLTWSHHRDAWQVMVDIDPYTNTPSYELVVKHVRCPAPVPAGRGCNP